tara:strand:+ start:85 stop:807 length:723 start_codon:yes stop_codon:yes gene_type:complete
MAKVHYQLSSGNLSNFLLLDLEEDLRNEFMELIKKEKPENPTNDERWKKFIYSRGDEFLGFKYCPFYKENIKILRDKKKQEIEVFNSKYFELFELFKNVDQVIEIVYNEDKIAFKATTDGEEVAEFNSEKDNVLTTLFANISENTEEEVKRNLPLIDYNRQQLENPDNIFYNKILNQFYSDLRQLFNLGEANWNGPNEYITGIEFDVFGTKVFGEGYLAEAKFDKTGIVWKLTKKEDDDY